MFSAVWLLHVTCVQSRQLSDAFCGSLDGAAAHALYKIFQDIVVSVSGRTARGQQNVNRWQNVQQV